MKPTKIDLWYQEFISSPEGEGAFMALEDLMGGHPEYEDFIKIDDPFQLKTL